MLGAGQTTREGEVMKAHYFNQDEADADDILLQMCIRQGYVPKGCLLCGKLVWGLTSNGTDPCEGCEGPREECHGRPKERGKHE